MVFPSLKNKRFGYVNLNLEAQVWSHERGVSLKDKNPLADAVVCADFVNDVHKKYNIEYSYGGWMEDRSFLWRGLYMESKNDFIHLGVDINVPPGTEIASDFNGVIARIDNDYPEEHGWGTRVFLKHTELPIVMIYAHVNQDVSHKVGDIIDRGMVFANVGKPPFNGNWFPHLHVQTLSSDYFNILEREDRWKGLDGYGTQGKIQDHAQTFIDPMQFISLL